MPSARMVWVTTRCLSRDGQDAIAREAAQQRVRRTAQVAPALLTCGDTRTWNPICSPDSGQRKMRSIKGFKELSISKGYRPRVRSRSGRRPAHAALAAQSALSLPVTLTVCTGHDKAQQTLPPHRILPQTCPAHPLPCACGTGRGRLLNTRKGRMHTAQPGILAC